ncbi:MAG: hypothetical protein Q9Q40_15535 [Acidobacteriota bacterium]|nr:hypothetical protein [Acidobacteriota bacterium]MDQ7088690.1 hypothetical protein [Acidobacteriota bacterium]
MRCDDFRLDLPAWREGSLPRARIRQLIRHEEACPPCADRRVIERRLADDGARLRAMAPPPVDVTGRVAQAVAAIDARRRQQRRSRWNAGLAAATALAIAAAAAARMVALWPEVQEEATLLSRITLGLLAAFEPLLTLLRGLALAAAATGLQLLHGAGRAAEIAGEGLPPLTLVGVLAMSGTIALIILRDLQRNALEPSEENRS